MMLSNMVSRHLCQLSILVGTESGGTKSCIIIVVSNVELNGVVASLCTSLFLTAK
jgi:hypothetical protein